MADINNIKGAASPNPEALKASPKTAKKDVKSFQEFLLDRQSAVQPKQELKFSAHARSRLASRHIELSPENLEKLTGAVEKVDLKGSKSSLIMLKDLVNKMKKQKSKWYSTWSSTKYNMRFYK